MVVSIAEGQTVYLKVREYSDDAMSCTVMVRQININDIGSDLWLATYGSNNGPLYYTGEPLEIPELTLYRDDQFTGETVYLVQGTDFVIDHIERDDEDNRGEVVESITEAGYYAVVYKGIGKCTGTLTTGIFVKDLRDIGGDDWGVELATYTVDYTGNPVVLPEVSVYRWDDSLEQNVYLQEGVDYELDHFENVDSGDELGYTPVEPGSYLAVFRGKGTYFGTRSAQFSIVDRSNIGESVFYVYFDGDNYFYYTGFRKLNFYIYDQYNIGNDDWCAQLDNDELEYTGQPAELPAVSIYNWSTALTQGTDFDFAYYTDEHGNKLDSAPIAAGEYYAVYAGKGTYRGKLKTWFRINPSANDLSQGTFDPLSSRYDYTDDPVELDYGIWDCEGNWLSDNCYSLVFFDADGNELNGAPTKPGTYTVVARASEEGEYFGQTAAQEFTIISPMDISSDAYSMAWENSNVVPYTGNPITMPSVRISKWDQKTDGYVYLTQGTDFQLAYIEDSDGHKLGSTPTEVGSYYAVFEGIGSYEGTRGDWFYVSNPYDLQNASVSLSNSDVGLVDGMASPKVEVVGLMGEKLVEGTDYDLVYTHCNEQTNWEVVELDGAPTSVGGYEVFARAKVGNAQGYFGEANSRSFWVYALTI